MGKHRTWGSVPLLLCRLAVSTAKPLQDLNKQDLMENTKQNHGSVFHPGFNNFKLSFDVFSGEGKVLNS